MNVENIQKVIEAIKNEENHFDMENYEERDADRKACGTPGCIGGWANYLAGDKLLDDAFSAADFLGIDIGMADQLFYGEQNDVAPTGWVSLTQVTRYDAVKTLEILIATGNIQWDHSGAFNAYGETE